MCPDIWIRLPRQRWPTSWANIEDPVVPLERNPCRHPVAGLWWERQFEEMFLDLGWGKSTNLGVSVGASNTRTILSVHANDINMPGTKAENGSHVEQDRWKTLILTNQHHFLIMFSWDVLNVNAKPNDTIIEECTKMFESRISAGATEKSPEWKKPHAKTVAWSYDMEGPARKCVEPYCELANKKVKHLYTVSSPCRDDHQVKQEEWNSVRDLSQVCSQTVLKFLYLARIGRPDILLSVNKLARAATKLRTHQDTFFSRCVSVVHFWRQRSCHQEGY